MNKIEQGSKCTTCIYLRHVVYLITIYYDENGLDILSPTHVAGRFHQWCMMSSGCVSQIQGVIFLTERQEAKNAFWVFSCRGSVWAVWALVPFQRIFRGVLLRPPRLFSHSDSSAISKMALSQRWVRFVMIRAALWEVCVRHLELFMWYKYVPICTSHVEKMGPSFPKTLEISWIAVVFCCHDAMDAMDDKNCEWTKSTGEKKNYVGGSIVMGGTPKLMGFCLGKS